MGREPLCSYVHRRWENEKTIIWTVLGSMINQVSTPPWSWCGRIIVSLPVTRMAQPGDPFTPTESAEGRGKDHDAVVLYGPWKAVFAGILSDFKYYAGLHKETGSTGSLSFAVWQTKALSSRAAPLNWLKRESVLIIPKLMLWIPQIWQHVPAIRFHLECQLTLRVTVRGELHMPCIKP